jgi:hypothetical protein
MSMYQIERTTRTGTRTNYGPTYATLDEAAAEADSLQTEVDRFGLDPSTIWMVTEIGGGLVHTGVSEYE